MPLRFRFVVTASGAALVAGAMLTAAPPAGAQV
jgi:hypothetical protein